MLMTCHIYDDGHENVSQRHLHPISNALCCVVINRWSYADTTDLE